MEVIPDSTKATKAEKTTPGRTISKERVSALLCANADGSHMLKTVIVGKSKKPRVIKNIMDTLPVHYYSSRNAWFTAEITIYWVTTKAIPQIKKYQIEKMQIPEQDVKASILLDNAPTHPAVDKLCSPDQKIKCMFLSANTTSVFQPMDQGVIYTAKGFYQRKFLNEILAAEEPAADEVDTRGQQTHENVKSDNIQSMIYNRADAVKEIKSTTLANSWKKLLPNEQAVPELKNYETEDFHQELQGGGRSFLGRCEDLA